MNIIVYIDNKESTARNKEESTPSLVILLLKVVSFMLEITVKTGIKREMLPQLICLQNYIMYYSRFNVVINFKFRDIQ